MAMSSRTIERQQTAWATGRPHAPDRPTYLTALEENLFLGRLHPSTEAEFRAGDGGELTDTGGRPAKMRSLISSSALAVNFFDAWRDLDKNALATALGLPPIADIRFEFKTRDYPVSPRSPNLDVLIHLQDGGAVGVESKFTEPFRSGDGYGAISKRYFPKSGPLWATKQLHAAQQVASRLQPEWIYVDAPQLLKHLLGLAHDPAGPKTLLYLWFDTGLEDARQHREEVARFCVAVADDPIAVRSLTYQELFGRLQGEGCVPGGWSDYMARRYFRPAV